MRTPARLAMPYSGIEVPDALWRYVEFGRGATYSDNQAEHLADQPGVLREFDDWSDAFAVTSLTRARCSRGGTRAYGYRPPSHFIADLKTKWRGLRMALGFPIPGTSPAKQQERGLNRDATIFYKKGEGAKLRGR